jgi:aerobic-type carbon monoxide dehydrogenase small subunit (CoxS/CutS family)
MRDIVLTINGMEHTVKAEDDALLLDVVREAGGCASVREGCGVGVCGACTAVVDGLPISTCLALVGRYHGAEILTAEGLPPDDPVVEAFVEAGAMQCGYCTPGFVLMVRDLLARDPDPTPAEVEACLASNTCRCGAYPEIRDAVARAAESVRSFDLRHRSRRDPGSVEVRAAGSRSAEGSRPEWWQEGFNF